ncbi:MAG TPA: LytTR family DNA-binding domain-containing protein [Flavobacteriales bacterium]|nr:LytTR family DNA-binding domain-containing protein [Flavobacteriales bacterium]
MEIKAILIDDEADSRSVLGKLLASFCPDVKILGEATNVEQAYEKINELKPELIFLDIQMPGGDGFSLLKKFKEIPFDVIFVTSYDQYAIEAIKFSALDYLMKPVEVSDLQTAVKKVQEKKAKKELRNQQLQNLTHNLESSGLEKRLTVHYGDSVKLLSLADIAYFEAERNYTNIFTTKKEKFNSSKNLGEYAEMLEPYTEFLRVNKGCLVNINSINSYSKGEPCIITLNGGQTFEISRRKKQEFLERMKKPA